MRRMGLCISLKAEAIAEYKRVHAAVWLEVLAVISRADIHSIYVREPENLLFANQVGSKPLWQPVPAHRERVPLRTPRGHSTGRKRSIALVPHALLQACSRGVA